jgi:hypothetical protein
MLRKAAENAKKIFFYMRIFRIRAFFLRVTRAHARAPVFSPCLRFSSHFARLS